MLPFRIGRTSFKLAVTSSNRFLPVAAHDLKGIAWLVASLQIWNSNNADVLLNSGLNLFDIMANLCSKLYGNSTEERILSRLHWRPIGSYSSDDPQDKNLKLSL